MKKIIKGSKSAAICQYVTLMIFIITILGSAFICWKVYNHAWTHIQDGEEFKTLAVLTFGASAAIATIMAPFALVIASFLGVEGVIMLILSTIALILNLHNPSLKKWKIARVLNLICTIIIIISLMICYSLPVINIILLAIIIFNIYIMFFYKPENLIVIKESENL